MQYGADYFFSKADEFEKISALIAEWPENNTTT
jgi:hypothetical protein